MPVDIVAQPASQAAQTVIYSPPLINQMIFGWPGDLLLVYFMGLLMFIIFGYFAWRTWWADKPVIGYHKAYWDGTSLGLKFSRNMKLRMVPLKYAAQIMEPDDPDDIEKSESWKQSLSQNIGQLGSVNTSIICDWHDWVENPVINEAIVTLAEEWNNNNPEDLVYDYLTFSRKLYNGQFKNYFKEGIRIPPYFIVDINRVEQYMPKQRDAASFSGWLRREAQMLNKNKAEPSMMPIYLMFGGTILICVLMLVFTYVFTKGGG
jgi:hypothetical protein